MRLLYRIQQYISITEYELRVLLVLCLLFGSGLALKAFQSRPPALPPHIYDDDMRLLRQGLEAGGLSKGSGSESGDTARTPSSGAALLPTTSVRIDLNTATAPMLVQLPEIGPATAARILNYRRRRGNFQAVDELMRVRGIGPRTLAALRPHVHVHEPTTPDSTGARDSSRLR